MNRRNLLVATLASAGALVAGAITNAGGFRWHLSEGKLRTSLLIGSAGAMVDLCKALAATYQKQNNLVDIVIEHGDSLQGLIAVKRGAIDVAAISRDLTPEEDDESSFSFLVARSHISIIVHPESPIKNLSQAQIKSLFMGEFTNWQQVGGNDAPVNLVSRMRGSSTRQFVEEVVLHGEDFSAAVVEVETTREVAAAVAADPNALGYISAKDDAGEAHVAVVAVDGVAVSNTTVLSNRYPYTHSFYLLLAGEQKGAKLDFVKFACSDEGQAIVAKQGLVAVC